MPLCHACQVIPIREVLRGPEIDRDFPWHGKLSDIKMNAKNCPLCRVLDSHLGENYRYKIRVKENDERRLWLNTSATQPPHIGVWIGDNKPEYLISGHHEMETTPGCRNLYSAIHHVLTSCNRQSSGRSLLLSYSNEGLSAPTGSRKDDFMGANMPKHARELCPHSKRTFAYKNFGLELTTYSQGDDEISRRMA